MLAWCGFCWLKKKKGILVSDRSVSLALRSSLRFYASEVRRETEDGEITGSDELEG
ncbi:hypothetical protein SLEP1_g49635 [Rubroshorea leprosula]|uniref:Uncharacterized protein n=1 Tax=Rubroshorea leprosula TaxID=152421 RepID=A0AAV5LZQ3_9ROSI|nr:hypothetical protein SLEP1_g49635 [Rubroshorea leprosula]